MAGRQQAWTKVIFGEPASKANSRRNFVQAGVMRSIKSAKAMGYGNDFAKQVGQIDPMFTEPVHMDITIYYSSERPDLDESLILDLLQNRIYPNDRLVRSRYARHHIDRDNPRAEISVIPLSVWDSLT